MRRLINYNIFFDTSFCTTIKHRCSLPPTCWRVAHLCGIPLFSKKNTKKLSLVKLLSFFVLLVTSWGNSYAQRKDILLNENWITSLNENNKWQNVTIPHNCDDYYGYRRLLHGNLHGDAVYKKIFTINQPKQGKRFFLFFEGAGSYATVFLNGKNIGSHAGGRTSFTFDATDVIKTNGEKNDFEVKLQHPANIKDLPWVCGGCSDERGFSEGSQPMGIFRPVHLIVTNDVRVEPFGVHAWADINGKNATLNINTSLKNYSSEQRTVFITHHLLDAQRKTKRIFTETKMLNAGDSVDVLTKDLSVSAPILWSDKTPYLYTIESTISENSKIIDRVSTEFGFRTIDFKTASHQFTLNGQPVFINGIAEYEHLLGQSHAFSNEQIVARMKWIQAAGFNAFRDGHQPHNLLYGKLCNQKGILWWTQLSAHVWYDTKEFRENFKTLLREWVIERRNDPSVILWGLQNESKLPKDFAEECTALIRSLDPTASTQRLVTTCNGGEGTDWDVPQNWTGTYGGNPATYGTDLKKQILVGEYGAWRTLDLHTEGGFKQNGILSEDRMTQLMEQKIRLAESVKDSVAGHFFWLLTSHDNPGRVQGGEGFRELDRIGPVNYKGLLTPWEEPTDAYYMFRSNYADKHKEPMVYIVSHTWPNRWMTPGVKDSIYVYSNCDEVELFNDIDNASLGKQKRNGIGTHFQWDKVNIKYNVLYAVGYVNGKAVARDTITLFHLPESPNFKKLYANAKSITKPQEGYHYKYRINCGGGDYYGEYGIWKDDHKYFRSWAKDFAEIPENFASQRRTFAPINNAKDWKLFQSFRYGKNKMQYEFDVKDGDYLVELYFIEPWLGVGSGINAKGMRIFDVAINGKTILNDLDIWSEVGINAVLKKTIKLKSRAGKIVISFPESKVGQALISAIAIAGTTTLSKTIVAIKPKHLFNTWLDIGDRVFANTNIQFNSLPSYLFGADWLQLDSVGGSRSFEYKAYGLDDLFLCVKEGYKANDLLQTMEHTNTQIITDENGGTKYAVYRKRMAKDDKVSININSNIIVCMQPVNNMQPAYDLKPSVAYRPATAKLTGEGLIKDTVNQRETIVFKKNGTAIEWAVNIGAADIYSLNIRYANEAKQNLSGKLEIVAADGTVMKTEQITFTNSKPGKWNYITTNTGSMINAGNYVVRIVADDAIGVGVSGLDIQ
jgi:beta-galactosidase